VTRAHSSYVFRYSTWRLLPSFRLRRRRHGDKLSLFTKNFPPVEPEPPVGLYPNLSPSAGERHGDFDWGGCRGSTASERRRVRLADPSPLATSLWRPPARRSGRKRPSAFCRTLSLFCRLSYGIPSASSQLMPPPALRTSRRLPTCRRGR